MYEGEKKLSLKNDYVFKRVFGKQENERITKALLEEIIESKISNIEIKSDIVTEKNLVDDKVGVLDIKAIIDNEINTNIEMQMVNSSNIIARMLFYWSKMYGQELKSGYDYSRAKKTIVILIADFKLNYLKNIKQTCSKWQIKNSMVDVVLTDLMELYIIELPKAIEEKSSSKRESLIRWLKFLENPENMEEKDMSEEMKEVKGILNEISKDDNERYLADLREKYVFDINTSKSEGYNEGKEIGLEEGRREGREEGIKEGRKEGRKEGKTEGIEEGTKKGEQKSKIEIAKKMLQKNMKIEDVMELTGLSKDEIDKIKL